MISKLVVIPCLLPIFSAILTTESYRLSVTTGTNMNVTELIENGILIGAPFAESAVDKLHAELWGQKRAARTTDVVIFNLVNAHFRLLHGACTEGGFATSVSEETTNLWPEYILEARTSYIYGIDSPGNDVRCLVTYARLNQTSGETTDDFWRLETSNPSNGSRWLKFTTNDYFHITPVLGDGDNNQVRLTIEDLPDDQKTTTPKQDYMTSSSTSETDRTTQNDNNASFSPLLCPNLWTICGLLYVGFVSTMFGLQIF